MAASFITHRGRVLSVSDGNVSVEIVSSPACASCQAASLCTAAEASRKVVQAPLLSGQHFNAGEAVDVCLAPSQGLKAVLLSYVVPVLVLLIFVVSLSCTGLSELLCGLAAVCGVGVYYLILFLFRKRLAGDYRFYIKTAANNQSI